MLPSSSFACHTTGKRSEPVRLPAGEGLTYRVVTDLTDNYGGNSHIRTPTVRTHADTGTCMYGMCTHAHTCTHMHAHTHARRDTHTHHARTRTHTRVYVCTHMYIHTHSVVNSQARLSLPFLAQTRTMLSTWTISSPASSWWRIWKSGISSVLAQSDTEDDGTW